MMQPPNPPPVIRAPSAPGGAGRFDGKVHLRHSDLESRRASKRARRPGAVPGRRFGPARSTLTASSTRAFSVTTWRTRRRITGSGSSLQSGIQVGDVSQRRHAEHPRGLLTAGSASCVFTVDQRMRCLGVQDQDLQASAGWCRIEPVRHRRFGSRRTARGRRCTKWQAAWSIKPVGAPTKAFSARLASLARSSPAMSRSLRSARAVSTAHSSAADDDKPAPVGTSDESTRSAPPIRCPASWSAHTTPATYACQPAIPGCRSAARKTSVESLFSEVTLQLPSSRGAAAISTRCARANGMT